MKKLLFGCLPAILFCIVGSFALPVRAETAAAPAQTSAPQEVQEARKADLPQFAGEAQAGAETAHTSLPAAETPAASDPPQTEAEPAEPDPALAAGTTDAAAPPDANITGQPPVLEAQDDSAAQEPEQTAQEAVPADQANFLSVMQDRPGRVVLTEPVVWGGSPSDSEPDAMELTTDTPVEVACGENYIAVEANSRLTFSGPFHFTGSGPLFRVGGDLILNGVSVTADGAEAAAFLFSDAQVPEGAYSMNLEISSADLTVKGADAAGVRMVQGATARITNTVITSAGNRSTGLSDAAGAVTSVYGQSRFSVTGTGAAGLIAAENTEQTGLWDFDVTASGRDSRGIVIPVGGACANAGTVTVSGPGAAGILLKQGAQGLAGGAVLVSGAESTGVLAEGDLEAARLSLTAERGMAAEAGGGMTLILCRVDTAAEGLLARGGPLVLDTCAASDIPRDAVRKTRGFQPYLNSYASPDGTLAGYDAGTFGLSVPAGGDRLSLPDTLLFSLWDREDAASVPIALTLPVVWETADYDPDRTGDYVLRYRADFDGLPIELAGPVTVHVYDPSQPRLLYAVQLGDRHTELHFTPAAGDAEAVRLWVSQDSGKTWLDYVAGGRAQAWVRLGFVETDALEENTAYLLQLELLGGDCAGRSPVLSYHRSGREIRWYNGDRDGGDQRPQPVRPPADMGTASPGLSQRPGPSAWFPPLRADRPQSVDAVPAAAENTPETPPSGGVVLTQQELADLAKANPEKITVAADGLKADFPADFLKNLVQAPDESLTAVLARPDERSFTVRLYAGRRELSSFDGQAVEVTVPDAGGTKQAVSQTGAPVPAKDTDAKDAVFAIAAPGTYSLDPPPEEDQTSPRRTEAPVWIFLSGVLLSAAVLFLFWLYGPRKRGDKL